VFVSIVASASCAKKKRVTTHSPHAPAGSETGLASWYGYPYHGRAAANGEIYDMEKMTAAHRTLPFGTWVRVTNLTNNKTVEVRITDRGPFVDGRIIDLSRAAARAIDLIGPGIAQVRLDIIPPPANAPTPAAVSYSIQIGVFSDRDRAERLCQSLEPQFGSSVRIVAQRQPGRPDVWRVLAGAMSNLEDANALAARLRQQLGEALVVRIDPAVSDAP